MSKLENAFFVGSFFLIVDLEIGFMLFRLCSSSSDAATSPRDRGSISPSFYAQLLRPQIPKEQKDSQIKQFFGLLGPESLKAVCKHVDEIDPG